MQPMLSPLITHLLTHGDAPQYLHGADVNPYMQSMHFFFAFGAFVAPLLVKLSQDTLGTYKYCWWFVSVFMVPVVAALLFYESPQDKSRQAKPAVDPESTAAHNGSEISLSFPEWTRTQWGVVVLTASFLFFYVGCEVATSNLLVSFVEDRQLADRDTAYSINASFWGGSSCLQYFFALVAYILSCCHSPGPL
jgi:fucose permease